MLRLAASQIGLNSKDLAWHKDRHHARQALRDDGHAVEIIASPVRSCPETPDNLKLALPYYFPCLSSYGKRIHDNDEDEDDDLFFEGLVPQESGTFWERIMINAGTPPGIQLQHVDRRPKIIEKSKASQRISRSLKGSIEHVLSGSMGTTEAHDHSGCNQYPSESSNDAERSSQLQSRFSINCVSYSSTSLDQDMPSSKISAEQLLASRAANVFTRPPSHRQDLVGAQPCRTHHQISGSRELDGSSDPSEHRHEIQVKRTGKRPDSQQGGYWPREDSTERAVFNGSLWHPRFEADSVAIKSSPPQDPYKLAMSPQLPVSRMVEAMRRRSNGLQRSSLHISHAAASSSPEKHSRASPDPSAEMTARAASSLEHQSLLNGHPSDGVNGASSFLSLPIRGGKNHTISSSSNFWNSQEVLQNPDSPQLAASLSEDVAQGRSVVSLVLSTALSESHASSFMPSPPQPLTPSPSSTPRRSLNPNAISFTPNNITPVPTPRQLFPSSNLSLPPPASLPMHPFSATPRSVSFSSSTASPSPAARLSPHSQPRLLSSPPSPHLTVYNDRLPAFSQPQTPAQLSRHGFSTMPPLRASGAGITQTAPVGDHRGSWPRQFLVALTPTRRSRYERLEDQENITVDAELDRRRLRDIDARRRREPRGGAGGAVGGGVGRGGRGGAGGAGDGLLATTPE